MPYLNYSEQRILEKKIPASDLMFGLLSRITAARSSFDDKVKKISECYTGMSNAVIEAMVEDLITSWSDEERVTRVGLLGSIGEGMGLLKLDDDGDYVLVGGELDVS